MNEVNIICPHSPEPNNITEISPDEGLSLLPRQDDKAILEEIFDDMYEQIEADLAKADSPEVVFSKYLWVIKMKEKAIDNVKATASKLIQDIEDWQSKKIQQNQGQIDFLCTSMQNYLKQKNLKSMQLAPGTIGMRKQQDKILIIDEELFYEKADSQLLRHIPEAYEPDMKKIKEFIKTSSAIPEGVDVTPQDPKFYYKLN
ncbi:MAG TPA: host-nuclease inhibitor Gam family protein [Ignavibacteria bacterium]